MSAKLVFTGIIAIGFFCLFSLALAQEATPLADPDASPTPIEYELPYPGILPDHPLYFLKALRDKILEILISDPIRQVEFHILMADKRLNMSTFLMNENKTQLAISTLKNDIEHLKKADLLVFKVSAEQNQKANTLQRLENSLLKHRETLTSLQSITTPADVKEQLGALYKEVDDLYQEFIHKK